MKNIVFIVGIIFLSTLTEPSFALDKNMPASAIKQIYKDYSTKAAYNVADSTDESDLILEVQNQQIFKFSVLNKEFAIIPFTYLPNENEPGSSRKCVIRILTIPGYYFLQDLDLNSFIFDDDDDSIPCNGVMALSFKDVNSDKAKDIIALFDFTTSGNKSMELEVAVFVYVPTSQKFVYNNTLSMKAAGYRIRNMKDALKNLK